MEREGRKHVQASKAILKNTPICLNAGPNLQPFTHFIIIFIKGQKHAAYLHPRNGGAYTCLAYKSINKTGKKKKKKHLTWPFRNILKGKITK